MTYTIDTAYFRDCLKTLLDTPSPLGYYALGNPLLERYARELGCAFSTDRRGAAYFTLEGQDNSRTVQIAAHMDTLGFVVRAIDANGYIRVRNMGGINYHSAEGETVTVHTRDGRRYTGLLACQSHSVHVFPDAKTMERDENTMVVLLDEPVTSKADVNALGIRHGDVISIEPRCEFTANGYIKSRFLDDKAGVAVCLSAIKYLRDNGLKPRYRTVFSFPYYEENGLGGNYVPEGVEEFLALDIGLVGPELDGSEYGVSICPRDGVSSYDYDLTTRLIRLAEGSGCRYAVDVFFRYSTDAMKALQAGHNIKAGVYGMAVICSHGRERTHITAIENTANLTLAYLLEG